jgi:hypothetical protein
MNDKLLQEVAAILYEYGRNRRQLEQRSKEVIEKTQSYLSQDSGPLLLSNLMSDLYSAYELDSRHSPMSRHKKCLVVCCSHITKRINVIPADEYLPSLFSPIVHVSSNGYEMDIPILEVEAVYLPKV